MKKAISSPSKEYTPSTASPSIKASHRLNKWKDLPLIIWFQENIDVGNIFPTLIQVLIAEYAKSISMWSKVDIGNGLTLSNDDTTVTKIGGNNWYDDWRSVRCDEWIENAIRAYTLQINNYDPQSHIHIGIITEKFSKWDVGYLGETPFGWSFQGHSSPDWCWIVHNGQNTKYGKVFKTGDILKVIVDTLDTMTLKYNLNGEDLGIAASNLPDKVALGVSIMHGGCQITIQD